MQILFYSILFYCVYCVILCSHTFLVFISPSDFGCVPGPYVTVGIVASAPFFLPCHQPLSPNQLTPLNCSLSCSSSPVSPVYLPQPHRHSLLDCSSPLMKDSQALPSRLISSCQPCPPLTNPSCQFPVKLTYFLALTLRFSGSSLNSVLPVAAW